MNPRLLALCICAILASASSACASDYSSATIESIIDDLVLVDAPLPGVDAGAMYADFIADETAPRFESGVTGVAPPQIPESARAIVRRGVEALPHLIDHLNDTRPTKLMVGAPKLKLFSVFGWEYYSRGDPGEPNACQQIPCGSARDFPDQYQVRVGDICFALIGQIVNRPLFAARYQPSLLIIVNSPIEAPVLIDWIKQDWAGLDAAGHEASLLADLRRESDVWQFGAALARLRFYYPATYDGLTGDDLRKRKEFEDVQ